MTATEVMTTADDPRVIYHHNGDYWTWNINGTTGASDMIEDVQAAIDSDVHADNLTHAPNCPRPGVAP